MSLVPSRSVFRVQRSALFYWLEGAAGTLVASWSLKEFRDAGNIWLLVLSVLSSVVVVTATLLVLRLFLAFLQSEKAQHMGDATGGFRRVAYAVSATSRVAVFWTAGLAFAFLIGTNLCRPTMERVSVGFVVVLLGAVLRSWAFLYKCPPNYALVVSGPYRFMRHPRFVGGTLMLLGFGLMVEPWLLTLPTLILIIAVYWRAADEEERYYSATCGPAYTQYCKIAGRWWPRFGRAVLLEGLDVAAARAEDLKTPSSQASLRKALLETWVIPVVLFTLVIVKLNLG